MVVCEKCGKGVPDFLIYSHMDEYHDDNHFYKGD